MQIFITRRGGFREVQRKIIPVMVVVYAGLFLLVIVVPAVVRNDSARWSLIPYTLIAFAAVAGLITRATLNRQRKSFETYKLIIDDEKLVRVQHNLPTITIPRRSVTAIVKNSNGSFTVTGESQLNAIGIPSQIADLDDLENVLARIRPIDVRTRKPIAEILFVPAALTAGLVVTVTAISSNRLVLLASSAVIVIVMTTGMVVILISKNVDKKTKRLSWISLLPIVAYLLYIFSLL
ncbi:MAG TPA: hypothetical protein VEB86_17140 [Chryseosolibacter sp.]|nr:hypothetical protein [Chryseosolibacter sp.]